MNTSITSQIAQEGIDLLNNSDFHQPTDVTLGKELVGQKAVVLPLLASESVVSYLIGQRQEETDAPLAQRIELNNKIQEYFDNTDLRLLCFELNIPYEDLEGESKQAKTLALVEHAQRHGRLRELASTCQTKRSHIVWPDFPKRADRLTIIDKAHLGVVVSVARPALGNAALFLSQKKIDANLVLITNVPSYDNTRFLDVGTDWEHITTTFHQTMQRMRLKFPKIRCHFFFAAPVPLAFLMGCTWGTVYQGDHVYHWHRDKDGHSYFVRVATISRALLGE